MVAEELVTALLEMQAVLAELDGKVQVAQEVLALQLQLVLDKLVKVAVVVAVLDKQLLLAQAVQVSLAEVAEALEIQTEQALVLVVQGR